MKQYRQHHHLTALLLGILSLTIALRAEGETTNEPSHPIQIIPSAQAMEAGRLEPSVEPTLSYPPLSLFQMGQLAESRTELLDAREKYRNALQQNPEDESLREHYAWFLYSNGYHDKECLRLLEKTLQKGNTSDPASLFSAMVEVRDELGLPATPMKKPPGEPKRTLLKGGATAPKNSSPQATSPKSSSFATDKNVVKSELEPVEDFKRWIFVPSYNTTFFNKARQNWNEEDVQLYYRANSKLILGAEFDMMQRPPSGTDTYYSAMASYQLMKYLEVHGKISICPDPSFLATQVYSGGVIYQVMPRLGLLLDYQRYNFVQGPIDQINPGLVYNFNDENWVCFRYVRGWAFYNLEYNYYSTALTVGLPGKRKMVLAFAYGTDPDSEVGAGNNNVNSLTPAYTYSAFFTQPLGKDVSLFAGATYCYRLKETGGQLYEQLTPTFGCVVKF